MKIHPTIDLRINSTCGLADFERDDVDVAIRYGSGNWLGVDAERLICEQVFPVCSPTLVTGRRALRTVEDLAGVTLLHEDIREDWRMWLKAAGCNHLDAARGPKFDDASSLIQAAIDGLGVALGRTLMVADDIAARRVVAPFNVQIESDWCYWLVAPRRRELHPHYPKFRDWLMDEVVRSRMTSLS